jgi:methionine-rich copper-binding protein CopC
MRQVRNSSIAAALLLALVQLAPIGVPRWAIAATPVQTTAAASAVASSSRGPVSITVSTSGSGKLYLTVSVGLRLTFQFQIPASDFHQTANSATLNTHGDLKSYGSINVTWARKVVGVPPTTSRCGGTTEARTVINFTQGVGTANLKLPCVGALSVRFGGPFKSGVRLPAIPSVGYFSGFVGTAFASIPGGATASLTVYKSSDPRRHLQAGGFITRQYQGGASAPLTSAFQSFHVTLPSNALRFSADLGSATLNSNTRPIRGTNLTWTAQAPATAPTTTTSTSCGTTTIRPTGGGMRASQIKGTVGLQTCVLSGSYPLSTSSFGQLYSSQLKAAAPLKITSISPVDKATGVATSTQIVAHFSVPVSSQYAMALLQGGSGANTDIQVGSTPTADSTGKVLTWTLQRPLKPNTTYTLTITVSVPGATPLSSKTSFTTGA